MATALRAGIVALTLALLGPLVVAAQPATPTSGSVDDVPAAVAATRRVIVNWTTPLGADEAASPARLGSIRAAVGGDPRLIRVGAGGAAIYDLGRRLGSSAAARLAALGHVSGVLSVEPDSILTVADLPNDTFAAELWGLIDGAPTGSPYGIDALGAWARSTGSGVVVAVVDTGLVAHADLVGQSVAGYDFISDAWSANDGGGRDADASDPGDWVTQNACGPGTPARASSWHGTHVAGTIAALANNAEGVFGGAPDVALQPVRVLGRCGGSLSDVADGIRWAAGGTVSGVPANPTPAKVINLSLSGQASCSTYLGSAITSARNNGAVVVAAAGNAGSSAANYAPGNCAGVLTVAATDALGLRAPFSNYDSSPGSAVIELAAPGVDVLSTIDSGATVPAGSAYAMYSGTSMAAPHVALSAALVRSLVPTLTVTEVESLLRLNSTPFATDSSSTGCSSAKRCGDGIVNAARAVAAAAAEGVPGAPTGVTAIPGDGQALVSWSAPASSGGSPISGYTATASPDGATCTTDAALSCTVAGLANGSAYTFSVRASNSFGDGPASASSGAVTPGVVDSTPPVVVAPVAALATGTQLESSKVPMVVSWSADDASGVAGYELQQSRNGGSWIAVGLAGPTATMVTISRPPASTYRFRLRATDGVGNTSAWAMGTTFKLVTRQENNTAIGYSGTWKRVSLSTAYGGALRHAKTSTAHATMSFNGHSVAWVAQRSSARGVADVYIDGFLVATVDLYSPAVQPRQVVFSQTWASAAKRTIQIRVRGTAGRPRVDLDALVFLK